MKKIYKIKVENKTYEVELEEVKIEDGHIENTPKSTEAIKTDTSTNSGISIAAPMPGTILDIKVNVGDNVEKGQVVAILEAMKMEMEVVSNANGKVSSISCSKGTNVILDELIMTIN